MKIEPVFKKDFIFYLQSEPLFAKVSENNMINNEREREREREREET